MSPMRLIILAVAAIAAVAAAMLVRNLANAPAPSTEAAAPIEIVREVEVSQTKVLVAKRDLRIGQTVTPEDFLWADWPENSVNPGHYTQDISPEAMEDLAGSIVSAAIWQDEPILPQKLVAKGETGYMAALLDAGQRAVTVEISPESASAGFILPYDRVDVILTYTIEIVNERNIEEKVITKTIMENARVLAIDQTFGDVEGVPTLTGSTATLDLAQDQAELMAMAARIGSLSLTLRSAADADFNNGKVVAKTELLEALDSGDNITVYRNGAAGGR